MSAGYSGRSLADKLGIKPGFVVAILGEPEGYRATLGRLPEGVTEKPRGSAACDFIHFFARDTKGLERAFPPLKRRLKPAGMLWVSWPKRASGVATDLGEAVVREIGLSNGLVDVKVAAVDETWSGLKFVIRLSDRLQIEQLLTEIESTRPTARGRRKDAASLIRADRDSR